jgi:hypothetical protein
VPSRVKDGVWAVKVTHMAPFTAHTRIRESPTGSREAGTADAQRPGRRVGPERHAYGAFRGPQSTLAGGCLAREAASAIRGSATRRLVIVGARRAWTACIAGRSLTDPGDRFDLDQHLGLRERRLHRGPCRRLCGEDLGEHAVHRIEVPDVGEVHGALQHIL